AHRGELPAGDRGNQADDPGQSRPIPVRSPGDDGTVELGPSRLQRPDRSPRRLLLQTTPSLHGHVGTYGPDHRDIGPQQPTSPRETISPLAAHQSAHVRPLNV